MSLTEKDVVIINQDKYRIVRIKEFDIESNRFCTWYNVQKYENEFFDDLFCLIIPIIGWVILLVRYWTHDKLFRSNWVTKRSFNSLKDAKRYIKYTFVETREEKICEKKKVS